MLGGLILICCERASPFAAARGYRDLPDPCRTSSTDRVCADSAPPAENQKARKADRRLTGFLRLLLSAPPGLARPSPRSSLAGAHSGYRSRSGRVSLL